MKDNSAETLLDYINIRMKYEIVLFSKHTYLALLYTYINK